MLNAPRMLGETDGDFLFSARVAAGFGTDFDAAALLVWFGGDRWAKLCFEFSPQRRPMVVSVVTQGRSDDANCFEVEDDHVFARPCWPLADGVARRTAGARGRIRERRADVRDCPVF